MNATTSRYEKYIGNINDGIIASLIATRLHNWMNNPEQSPELSTKDLGISIVGTFDNNRMYLTSDLAPIDPETLKAIKQLTKTYFHILLPFQPKVKMTFRDRDYSRR